MNTLKIGDKIPAFECYDNTGNIINSDELMGKKLNDLKISKAVFDRGGYIYHGRVKSLADGIREKGVEF